MHKNLYVTVNEYVNVWAKFRRAEKIPIRMALILIYPFTWSEMSA